MMKTLNHDIWVFGDYRNYFQNRVTLQLLARAGELAPKTGGSICAIVFGHDVGRYVSEYIAHGAEKVYVVDHPQLKQYSIEAYTGLMERLVKAHGPEILLIGATCFGKEYAPKVAKRLKTGLTADCIDLDINKDGLMIQTSPSFGGNLIAEILTPNNRPQVATVRAGTFQEIPHNADAKGEVISMPIPNDLPMERVRLIRSERLPKKGRKIEDTSVVICGGRGMGSKQKFKKIFELARLMDGEVGATRPVVHAGWSGPNTLVGQAGRQISPKILISFGISGAIQHTAALGDADFIIAVNKNPNATMMKMADVAVVADANQACLAIIKAIKEKIQV
jgi:electron transfer flavoprotein alpha subunit